METQVLCLIILVGLFIPVILYYIVYKDKDNEKRDGFVLIDITNSRLMSTIIQTIKFYIIMFILYRLYEYGKKKQIIKPL